MVVEAGRLQPELRPRLCSRSASPSVTDECVRPLHRRLAGAAQGLGAMQGRDAGDGGDHHAGEQLHSSNVAIVESSWG